jgi:transposase
LDSLATWTLAVSTLLSPMKSSRGCDESTAFRCHEPPRRTGSGKTSSNHTRGVPMDHTAEQQAKTINEVLVVAIELSSKHWKLAFHDGRRERARIATIAAWEFEALSLQIERARKAMSLEREVRIVSCYEAGREGFSVHRRLLQLGVESVVIDAASVEVSRRWRNAKTDRLDAEKLAMKLLAHLRGERAFSVVRVPKPEDEAVRHEQRELQDLKIERARHRQRIQSWLLLEGIPVSWRDDMLDALEEMKTVDGRALSRVLLDRIRDEAARLSVVSEQIKRIETGRRVQLKNVDASDVEVSKHIKLVHTLTMMRGIGETSAHRLVRECFAWRKFNNRREVAGFFGLSPTPFASGKMDREQGIAKLGRGALRSLLIELAWFWLRYQPTSRISKWYAERFATGGARQRRVGIVAVARKIAIALWAYLDFGLVPEGALMKT